MHQPKHLTRLLNEWRTGEGDQLNQVYTAVLDELNRLAQGYMRSEIAGHTLQATALVNEAFLRVSDINTEIQDRGHFIGIVANLMRQILIDHARAKRSLKRGGDLIKLDIDVVELASDGPNIDVLALENVLTQLQKTDPRKVQIAELYYFCGGTYKEVAIALNTSLATVQRELSMIKAILAVSLEE